jgi:nucleotide-binding universal stress UspA family protein
MRVLIATDGSKHSDAAIQGVLARPWPEGSSFRVISVAALPYPLGHPYLGAPMVNYQSVSESISKEARTAVELAAENLRRPGLEVEAAVLQGDARVEIVQAAADWVADLIVVGSHGRTGVSRWLLGSVAEYVVRHAPCSVEVARSRQAS